MTWKKKINKIFYNPPHAVYKINSKRKLEHLTHLTEHLDTIEIATNKQFDNLRHLTNTIDIAVWGKNKHGRYVFLNKACAKKILNSTIEKALNMTDTDFEKDALAQVCIASDNIVMDSMATKRFLEYADYDGIPLWVDCTKSPWIQDGKLIGTIGSAKNITSIVPKELKERHLTATSIEIDVDITLCKEEINNIINKEKIKR